MHLVFVCCNERKGRRTASKNKLRCDKEGRLRTAGYTVVVVLARRKAKFPYDISLTSVFRVTTQALFPEVDNSCVYLTKSLVGIMKFALTLLFS
jgi:hypothetical protein